MKKQMGITRYHTSTFGSLDRLPTDYQSISEIVLDILPNWIVKDFLDKFTEILMDFNERYKSLRQSKQDYCQQESLLN